MRSITYRNIGIGLVLLSLMLLCQIAYKEIHSNYIYNTKYTSYWELSDRSSTIQAKQEYMNTFVDLIENNSNEFSEYNAVFLKTPQNKFSNNLEALKSLRQRLNDIKGMNESSFEYQTAIQQITAQEQGQAQSLLSDIEGSWYLNNYPILWGWIEGILVLGGLAFLLLGLILWFMGALEEIGEGIYT